MTQMRHAAQVFPINKTSDTQYPRIAGFLKFLEIFLIFY